MTTPITKQEFDELNAMGGAPFDVFDEPGQLGVAFANESGLVKIWEIDGQGCVLEEPNTVAQAKQILAP